MSKMFDALRRAEAERKRRTGESEPTERPSIERVPGPRLEAEHDARMARDPRPVVPFRDSAVTVHIPDEGLSGELLREVGILHNSLESKLGTRGKRVLMFTSGMHEEGVTTLAIAYCQLLAMQGHQRVLLVELNARRPALAERLGLGPGEGVAHYFREARPLAGLVRHLPDLGFDVLRVGDADPTHIQIYLEKVFPRLRDEALRSYDAVIVDAPPVVLAPETPPIAGLVDGIVVVVLCGKSKRETVQRSINLLRQFNGQVLGVVLNRKRYFIPSFIYRRL